MKKILVVEDDVNINNVIEELLQKEDFMVNSAYSGTEALLLLEKEKYDLILLDLMLPGICGEEIIKRTKNIPIIVLSAKVSSDDKVACLLSGASDYITKPFSSKELLVRINKIINRNKKENIIKVKDITFDSDKMEVYKNGENIKLSALEIKILALLFAKLNKVVTRGEIIDNIWNWTGNDVNDNTVTVYLKRLREKLDSDIIKTIKGIGYRIDKDD